MQKLAAVALLGRRSDLAMPMCDLRTGFPAWPPEIVTREAQLRDRAEHSDDGPGALLSTAAIELRAAREPPIQLTAR